MLTALAYLCLLSPYEPPATILDNQAVWTTLEKVVHKEEVWSRYDYSVYGSKRSRTEICRTWRERYPRMRDWPHLYELERFHLCDAEFCRQQVYAGTDWADRQRRRLDLPVNGRTGYAWTDSERVQVEAQIATCESRVDAWRSLLLAQYITWEAPVRRADLQELRTRLGAEAFYAGRMPDPIPH